MYAHCMSLCQEFDLVLDYLNQGNFVKGKLLPTYLPMGIFLGSKKCKWNTKKFWMDESFFPNEMNNLSWYSCTVGGGKNLMQVA